MINSLVLLVRSVKLLADLRAVEPRLNLQSSGRTKTPESLDYDKMRKMKAPSFRLTAAWLGRATLAFLLASHAYGQTFWSDGVGSWFSAFNWTAGVPNPASATSFDARIDNGGIAQILAGGGSVRRITLGA